MHAMLCFPSSPISAYGVLEGEDKELALLGVKAWNDFSLDEWCATDPARFIPMAITPLWDPHSSSPNRADGSQGRPSNRPAG